MASRTYGEWKAQQERKAARNETIALLAAAAASEVIGILLALQLTLGRLRWLPLSDQIALAIVILLVGLTIAMVIAPKPVLTAVSKAFHGLTSALLFAVSTVLIALVYLVTLPLAATLGVRSYVKRHPPAAAWARRDADWRVPTWQPKQLTLDDDNAHKSTLVRSGLVFLKQRNYLLLAILVILLLLATIAMFAKTSAAAPFIYTLF